MRKRRLLVMVEWLQRPSLSLRRVLIVKELTKLLTEVLFITARKPKNNGSVVLICIRFVNNYTFWTCKQIKTYNEKRWHPIWHKYWATGSLVFAWWMAFLGQGLGRTSNFSRDEPNCLIWVDLNWCKPLWHWCPQFVCYLWPARRFWQVNKVVHSFIP